ncbi:MAG: VOC family protein [Planctomycetota bacterium]
MPPKPNPVGWFEVPTTDLGRAKAFYEQVFDTEISLHEVPGADGQPVKMGWFPMEHPGSGAAGSLVEHPEYKPSADGVVVYFSVADIVGTLAKAEAAGGTTLVPETPIGEHGFFAWLSDTEGNRIALHRPPTP